MGREARAARREAGARRGQPMGGRGRGVAVRKRQAEGGAGGGSAPHTRRVGRAGRARGKREGKREKGTVRRWSSPKGKEWLEGDGNEKDGTNGAPEGL